MATAKIYIGDGLDVLRSMESRSVNVVCMDPPYASGAFSEAARQSGLPQGVKGDESSKWFVGDGMGTAGLVWLLRSIAFEATRVLVDGGWLLCFCDWRQITNIAPALESAGLRFRSLVIWDKGSAGMGVGFRPQHECILCLTTGTGMPAVHAFDDSGNVMRVNRVSASDKKHPTAKPVDLMRKLLRITCPVGGLVVDPFAGSGSTLVAAVTLGMNAVGVERSPEFAAIAVERLRDECDVNAETNATTKPATQPTLFGAP